MIFQTSHIFARQLHSDTTSSLKRWCLLEHR